MNKKLERTLMEAAENGLQVEFAAKKKPRGVVVKKLKSGVVKVVFETTQEQLDEIVARAAEEHKRLTGFRTSRSNH